MMRHWADERTSATLELPVGTCVLVENGDDESGLMLHLKPVTDQPSAREELALALERAASELRRGPAR